MKSYPMFKKQARVLSLVQGFIDAVCVFCSWKIAYFIRFNVFGAAPGQKLAFVSTGLLLSLLSLMLNIGNHLYESNRYFAWHREALLMMKSQFQALAAFVVLLYFFWPIRLSRATILVYAGISLISLLFSRTMIRTILNRARSRGRNLRHVIVAGGGSGLKEYVGVLLKDPARGIRFTAWVDSGGLAESFGIPEVKLEDISFETPGAPDAAFIGYEREKHEKFESVLSIVNKTFVQILVVPSMEHAFIGYTIEDFHGLPMVCVNSSRISIFQSILKRSLDILGSLFALVLLSPVYLILAFLVKLTSRGPVFYGQERMTQDGETFNMWKFRSMRTDAESGGARWAARNDDRHTPIGAFLRKTSLDEIPQFWNVLKGEMSLVGPRPERPVFIDKFKHEIPSYMLRHRMKAGITGWAQVNGWRGDTSLEKRIECDLHYIRNWNILFDLKILLLTVLKGLIHENAY